MNLETAVDHQLDQIPQLSVDEIEADPKLADYTYHRQQWQRCHPAIKGREKRGDYRGMCCSSCQIPYGNAGYGRWAGKPLTMPASCKALTWTAHAPCILTMSQPFSPNPAS